MKINDKVQYSYRFLRNIGETRRSDLGRRKGTVTEVFTTPILRVKVAWNDGETSGALESNLQVL